MRCTHCNLNFPESALKKIIDEGRELYFCCNGCEGVYFLLKNVRLESFYQKRGDNTLKAPNLNEKDLAFFDSKSFAHTYIKQKQNICRVALILEHIHCAACIWLNESILNAQIGVRSASINYTNNKLILEWDKEQIALSAIIKLIRSIGYDAYAYDPNLQESRDKKETQNYYIRLVIGIFCTMNIMWIAVAQYSGYFLGIDTFARNILNLASFFLCTTTMCFCGFVFYRGAYYGLKSKFIGMDLLVSSGSTLTYTYSIYAALSGSGETYFESVSMIITFVMIGKFLEIRSRKSAGEELDRLNAFSPQSVNVLKDKEILSKHPDNVQIGEEVLVLAGEKIAIDGILCSDTATLNTQAINGESTPISKKKGEEILSGCVNLLHRITYKTSKLFSQSLINEIVELVEKSLSSKPKIQNLANSISQNFSKVILSIALLGMFGWYFIGEIGFEKSLIISISVIIIACPCALALATPIATIIGISRAYTKNIIFKEARFLETLAKSNVVIFDKTGTLTKGVPKVILTLKNVEKTTSYGYIHALIKLSLHPISKAITQFLENSGVNSSSVEVCDFTQVDSKGMYALCNGHKVIGGNLKFLIENGIELDTNLELSHHMVFGVGIDGVLKEIFVLEDELKPNAKELITYLQAQNINTLLLSGDRRESVESIAQELGIKTFYAEYDVLAKAKFIEELKKSGVIIAMVGDGINDAPALSKADISVSFARASDLALSCSNVIILDEDAASIKEAFYSARLTYKVIKENILLSIVYNALSIPVALAGLVIPLFAALSMSFSSILVVLNSLKISKKRHNRC